MRASGNVDVDGDLCADLDGLRLRATVVRHDLEMNIIVNGRNHALVVEGSALHATEQEGGGGRLTAPMPGKVLAIKTADNARISKGDTLLILEAMKMEHQIIAPRDGEIASVKVIEGDQVANGELLIEMIDLDTAGDAS